MTDDEINLSAAKDPEAYSKSRHTPTTSERKAIESVLEAWIHQRDKGFDLAHDLSHPDGALSLAASAYATHGLLPRRENTWPFGDGFNPEDRKSNLVRSAALLLSEIVRLEAEVGRGKSAVSAH